MRSRAAGKLTPSHSGEIQWPRNIFRTRKQRLHKFFLICIDDMKPKLNTNIFSAVYCAYIGINKMSRSRIKDSVDRVPKYHFDKSS